MKKDLKDYFAEDDIFIGTPEGKFLDILKNANETIVSDELDKILEKYAAMELLLSQDKEKNYDINKDLEKFILNNLDEVSTVKNDLYMEFTGEIVSKLDS